MFPDGEIILLILFPDKVSVRVVGTGKCAINNVVITAPGVLQEMDSSRLGRGTGRCQVCCKQGQSGIE